MHPRLTCRGVAISVFGLAVVAATAALADNPGKTPPRVDFARDVLPILQRSCFECHGPEKQKGKLRLDSKQATFKGGSSGAVIVPGKADASDLYRRIVLPKGTEEIMPARGEPLSKAQTEIVRDWINQGAIWPDGLQAGKHWAYVKPVRPSLPEVKQTAWPRTPIDRFILARLEKEGLQPAPEADRATLLRRVSLDLTGLPPTSAEVEAFLSDSSPGAYETVVDRLLASPHFGERWARPWLDLARYADSHGFQRDDLRDSWAYRDWVIQALNADMPFDQFTIEQLAGDLLPPPLTPPSKGGDGELTPPSKGGDGGVSQKIATGFHRCTPINVEAGSDPEETRVNQLIDRVNTTATVWLGSTLECAQCHDHKYDPFSQKDYYQFLAFFNGTAIEADRANPMVPGSIRFLGPFLTLEDSGQGEQRRRLEADLRRLDQELETRRQQLRADLADWETKFRSDSQKASQTHPLDVADFISAGGAGHKLLDDHSVLLVDDPPDTDTYTVTVHTKLRNITGFKLEALTDPSLPGTGPGRGDAQRPNFVLNTFSVQAAPTGGKTAAVKLVNARADFSQTNFDVAGAVDNDPKTAWAINPQFQQSHWATFETEKPLDNPEGTTLTFALVQNFGRGRTIGRLRLSALTGDLRAKSLPAKIAALLQAPPGKRSAEQTEALLEFRVDQDATSAGLKAKRVPVERALKALQPATTLAMQELAEPRTSSIFVRGNFREPGMSVRPAAPSILHPLPEGSQNRLTLARWLVHPDNPLAARATVNRWWAELFGRGIVATVEDFGVKGEPPTHPELLDWLAVEFMTPSSPKGGTPSSPPLAKGGMEGGCGWSMKKLLKHLVLSATYRQSSKQTPELRQRDDQNQLHARGPRFRMDAEMIRDNALVASGLLDRKQFGPPIRPYQPTGIWSKIGGARAEYVVSPGTERHRRGIYVVWKRGAPYPSFVNFDATARLACTVKRSRANTPLQALTLLNDPVYVEAAMALARRIVVEKPQADIDERIRYAFRLCLVRAPLESEVRILRKLFDAQREASRSDLRSAKQLLDDFSLPPETKLDEFAAWYAVASALLNLDEMITKG